LCSLCAENWSRRGLSGECTECEGAMGIAWVVVGCLMAAAVVGVALYTVSGANASTGKISVLIVLAKIAITLIQILTQLESPLQLQWPGNFAWFVNLLKVFSFEYAPLSQFHGTVPVASFISPVLLSPRPF
jgi:hypothetical protein